jgi:CubicO group peptidase (beta-lactamase class C family)
VITLTVPSTRPIRLLALAFALAVAPALAEPDEDALGKAQGYPRGTPATMFADAFKVGSFSAADQILPMRSSARGGPVTPLPKAAAPPELAYQFKGARYSIADYLDHQRVTSLLVLKNGETVAEHYRYGRTEHDRFVSFSMAKSVTSMLIGIALEKGLLKSPDETAESYVPQLKGTGYGQATIRQLLRMSSGVKFSEDYQGKDDSALLSRAQRGLTPGGPLAMLASFTERAAPAGEKFAYASSESTVLGYVLTRALHRDLAAATSEWVWQPLGAEADAAWNVSVDGQEETAGRFNATLRDYARLGLLLAHDGAIGGRQIVPQAYLLEATTAAKQPDAFQPRKATPYFGYGYQFWIFPLRVRTFALLGIFGQAIYVQPETGIGMVQTAVYGEARDTEAAVERDACWRGVLQSLGGSLEP